MTTLRVNPAHPDPAVIARAAAVLREGGLVAFPTETVYGLGAHALDPVAVRRIYEAKGRPGYNPLIVHVADAALAREVAAEWPPLAERLAAAFWPGPLTLVLPKRPVVPDEVTAGLPSVAVRVPAHPVALALLRAAQLPVAAPSANRFTQLSPTLARHVERGLGDRVDLVLDGGPTSVGIESTVLDLTGPVPVLLRPGVRSIEELARVAGPIRRRGEEPTGEAPRPSPGMVDRHYAPRAALRLSPNDAASLARAVAAGRAGGRRVGLVARTGSDTEADARELLPDEPAGYARALYAALHALDDAGCDVIVVARVPDGAEWDGVRDRLARAERKE